MLKTELSFTYSGLQTDLNKDETTSSKTAHSGNVLDDPCHAFTDASSGRQQFYSPGWPNPYPNHTDCVLVLEAPRGYLLRLDFRDCFDMEPSDDCRFDFLEVRDGAHGYCQLLGQFCGKDFPPMITSTDRYLWLRFHSDENIEYSGFKAVYEFIPRSISSSYTPELDTCRIHVTGSEGSFSSADIPEDRLRIVDTYKIAIDCMWVITVKEGWKIQISFPEFKLDKPNDCDNNFVDVFSDRTDLPSRQKNFCGSIADSVTSKNNIMFVRFFATARAIKSKFTAMYTAFREKKIGEICAKDEWDCEDTTCISIALRCNGKVNCRFRWDEDNCITNKTVALNSEHIVIIMVVFSFILSGMCITFVFHCFKKLIRDYQTIQDHMRINCEQQLNILGHKSDINIPSKDHICRTNSGNKNFETQKSETVLRDVGTCYVPNSEMLPVLIQNHTANTVKKIQNGEYEQPIMCDNGSQTKDYEYESQYQQTDIPSPPSFSTFGYDRYPDEDLIESEDSDRVIWPHCVESGKSAPDVIATH